MSALTTELLDSLDASTNDVATAATLPATSRVEEKAAGWANFRGILATSTKVSSIISPGRISLAAAATGTGSTTRMTSASFLLM